MQQVGIIAIWLVCIMLLVACAADDAAQAPDPTHTIIPTMVASATQEPSPTATPVFTFERGATIAGVDIGGLEEEEAVDTLEHELPAILRSLEIYAGNESFTLRQSAIELEIPIVDLVEEARYRQEQSQWVRVPLQVSYDEDALRQYIQQYIDEQPDIVPDIQLIRDSETISRSFAYTTDAPGFNIDDAMKQIHARLTSNRPGQSVILEPVSPPEGDIPRPDAELLRQEIEALAAEWEGVVGLYLHDLESGEVIALNADTVFSAASVIKVGILLYAHITVSEFDPELQDAINAMIIESDNLKANDVLAATVGGSGTDAAYDGVLALNDFLQELGFQHTYMNMPFEAYDYLVGIRGLSIAQGPPQEGSPPYTKPDTILRTTPAEISRLFLMIEACSGGEGELLERYPEQLSAAECQDMLDVLAQNADTARLVAGIPEGVRVEHKSGWTQFMHADVGFVRSPGGDYLLAIYLWRDVEELPDVWANPYIEALSRLVYTAYNPVEL